MKAAPAITTATAALFALMTPALAASGAREDNSDLVVWGFLAFCALIVIGQLFPMIRSLRTSKPRVVDKVAKEKA